MLHAKSCETTGAVGTVPSFRPLIFVLFGVLFLSNQMPPETSVPTEVADSEIKALIRNGMVSEATLETAAIVAVLHHPTVDGLDRVAPSRSSSLTPRCCLCWRIWT